MDAAPFCTSCGKPLAPQARFCANCGTAAVAPVPTDVIYLEPDPVPDPVPAPAPMAVVLRPAPAPPAPVPAITPSVQPPPAVQGRPHSPVVAAIVAVLPGAGQTYNGEPFKALAFLLFSPLLLPWIWSFFDAYAVAARMVKDGGRYERGGFVWVFLQAWLVFNVALAVLLGLTVAGVLQ